MPTNDDIIQREINSEGGYSNDPADKGGETQYGISKVSNPTAWTDGPPTEVQAREIYRQKYLQATKLDQIQDYGLRTQLVDWAVTSGPFVAISHLQDILGVHPDGLIGPQTLQALLTVHPEAVSNALVAARVKMIARVVQRDPSQLKYLLGWLSRAVEFL